MWDQLGFSHDGSNGYPQLRDWLEDGYMQLFPMFKIDGVTYSGSTDHVLIPPPPIHAGYVDAENYEELISKIAIQFEKEKPF